MLDPFLSAKKTWLLFEPDILRARPFRNKIQAFVGTLYTGLYGQNGLFQDSVLPSVKHLIFKYCLKMMANIVVFCFSFSLMYLSIEIVFPWAIISGKILFTSGCSASEAYFSTWLSTFQFLILHLIMFSLFLLCFVNNYEKSRNDRYRYLSNGVKGTFNILLTYL